MNMKLTKEVEANLEDIEKVLLGLPEEELVNLWNKYAENEAVSKRIFSVDYPNEIIKEESGEPLDVLSYITRDYDIYDNYCSMGIIDGEFLYYSFYGLFDNESPFELWRLADYVRRHAEEYMGTYLKGFHLIKEETQND